MVFGTSCSHPHFSGLNMLLTAFLWSYKKRNDCNGQGESQPKTSDSFAQALKFSLNRKVWFYCQQIPGEARARASHIPTNQSPRACVHSYCIFILHPIVLRCVFISISVHGLLHTCQVISKVSQWSDFKNKSTNYFTFRYLSHTDL